MTKYITIKTAAKLLHVTPLTLRNWDKSGKLKAYRHPVNNYRVYRLDQIEEFLRRLEGSRVKKVVRKIDIF
jgi:site-specific DNA-methyltransferase (adenine-specific)